MASSINPNNIDGLYPVAGQDNNSQGFRDNFTNTRTNFGYARDEITELQSKAVLKSALSGTVLNNNMNGAVLSGAQFQNTSETRLSIGSFTGSVIINYAVAPYQTLSTAGSVSLDFSNFSPAGTVSRVRLQIDVTDISHTLTLPLNVSIGAENLQGSVNNVITFSKTGVYEFEFETNDQGGTISVFDLSRNYVLDDPIYLPSVQLFAANGNVSLTTTSTVITSSTDLTGTLAAGAEGQVKILAYGNTSVGNALITVTNAAWSTGTANLSAVGSAATFQYINGKWFCVGNNGVSFS
jgi:hypothetical protein